MKSERNIREIFGVDYVKNPSKTAEGLAVDTLKTATGSPPDIAESLFEQAEQTRKIMQMKEVLRSLTNGTGKLNDLFAPTGIDFQTLLVIAGNLEKAGLIKIVDRNQQGNWNITITSQGREFLSIID
jgi:predicted transcriptional regulator